MASKGQKLKKYTPEFKKQILKEYFSGEESPKSLQIKYGVPAKTVELWCWKTKRKNIDIFTDHRKGNVGRPKTKELTIQDYKERYEILKKYQVFLQARRGKK